MLPVVFEIQTIEKAWNAYQNTVLVLIETVVSLVPCLFTLIDSCAFIHASHISSMILIPASIKASKTNPLLPS